MSQLNPRIGELGASVLNSRVEPVVQGALAALSLGRRAFTFTRISMGSARPRVENIRAHKPVPGKDRIVVDFDLIYLGDADIQVSLLGVAAGVRDVRVEGRARLVLCPTIPHLPFVGGLQLLFLDRPRIQFSFQGAARLAAKLPAIQEKVVEDLQEELSKEVVWPNRLILPLSSAADPRQVWQPQPGGFLCARLRSVSGLPKKSGGLRRLVGQHKPDPYGLLTVGGEDRTTSVAKNTQQHTWNVWHSFLLEEVEGHLLDVDIMDKDKASRDEFLGRAKFSLDSHLPAKPSSNSSTKLVSASLPLQPVAGKRTKYPKLSGQVELELVWRPLLATPPQNSLRRSSTTSSSIPCAVLTLFLYSANNLNWYSNPETAVPAGHQPVPRASLVLGSTPPAGSSSFQPDGEVQTTSSVRRSRQVELNEGFKFLLGEDWSSKSIRITMEDYSQGGKTFGSWQIGMRELVGQDLERASRCLLGEGSTTSSHPEQTFTLSAQLRFAAPSSDVS